MSPLSHSDEAADAALVRDLLDPLMRTVLYTTENINRRQVGGWHLFSDSGMSSGCCEKRKSSLSVQAAAIAAHFVHSGKHSSSSVKYFMKKLKDFDTKLYLEVQMSTLRTCYNR